jgi:hypothetical protein
MIELDMNKKDQRIIIETPAFSAENGVVILNIKMINFELGNKDISVNFSPTKKSLYEISVDEDVIKIPIYKGYVLPGQNRLQVNFREGEAFEQSPFLYWDIIESIDTEALSEETATEAEKILNSLFSLQDDLQSKVDSGYFIGPEGPRGPKGDSAQPLNFKGTKESITELPAEAAIGDAYTVGTEVYVFSNDSIWINIGSIQGPQGEKGLQGEQGPKGEDSNCEELESLLGIQNEVAYQYMLENIGDSVIQSLKNIQEKKISAFEDSFVEAMITKINYSLPLLSQMRNIRVGYEDPDNQEGLNGDVYIKLEQ